MFAAVMNFFTKNFTRNEIDMPKEKSELEVLIDAYNRILAEFKQAEKELERSSSGDEDYIWDDFLAKRKKLNKIISDIKKCQQTNEVEN